MADQAQAMFGSFDPELLKRAIAVEQERNLMEQAKMTPGQIQNYVAGGAGQRLGEITNSLFGVEAQDPRIKRAQMAQSIINEVNNAGYNPNTPAYFEEAARLAMNNNMSDFANVLIKQGRDLAKSYADVGKERAQTALYIKQASGEGVVKTPADVAIAAGALNFPVHATIDKYTPEQLKAIDIKVNEDKLRRAEASAARLTFDNPKDKFAAITEVNTQVKPLVKQIDALDQAMTLRRNDKSPFSQKLFEQTVAGAFGDSQKAASEISRLVNTGNLGERVTNTLNMFLSGNIGNATKEDQLESLSAIREYAAKQYNTTIAPYRSAAGAKADEVAQTAETRFNRPKLPPNQQYIPMNIVNQYNMKKGQRIKQGDKEFVYNGDGTITILTKGQ